MPGNFNDLRSDIESECLSSLEEGKLSQSLAYKISKVSANCANRFPKWKVMPDVKESKINLYFMDNSPINVQYQVIVFVRRKLFLCFHGTAQNIEF